MVEGDIRVYATPVAYRCREICRPFFLSCSLSASVGLKLNPLVRIFQAQSWMTLFVRGPLHTLPIILPVPAKRAAVSSGRSSGTIHSEGPNRPFSSQVYPAQPNLRTPGWSPINEEAGKVIAQAEARLNPRPISRARLPQASCESQPTRKHAAEKTRAHAL